MASKRRLRRKKCGSKLRYKTENDAIKAIIHIYKNRPHSGKVVPYFCSFCKYYHIGHQQGMIKQQFQNIYLKHQFDFV